MAEGHARERIRNRSSIRHDDVTRLDPVHEVRVYVLHTVRRQLQWIMHVQVARGNDGVGIYVSPYLWTCLCAHFI
jgi:hypothetical protein